MLVRLERSRSRSGSGRPGVAATELAVLLLPLAILLFGLWDVGRILEVQQVLSNAAREGAREAAAGLILDSSTGFQKNVLASDVQTTVTNYLTRNGISTTGVTITFSDLDNPSATDPYQAVYLEHLRVTVQLPFSNVRLILANAFVNITATNLTGTADWLSARDKNVTVTDSCPTN